MDKKGEVERLAYELYERSGFVCGHDLDHWFEAERIVYSILDPEAKPRKTASGKGGAAVKKAKTAKTAAAPEKKKTSAKPRAAARPKKSPPEERAQL
jgi:hypothetical protein